jgi:hypothetical protein
MAYIAQKKVWRKKIDQETLDRVWAFFQSVSPAYAAEWEVKKKSMFLKITETYGNFIHPETDIEDDSVGIQPKQIKKWIEKFSVESLENLFFILGHKVRVDRNLNQRYLDQDGFVAWERLWVDFVDPEISQSRKKDNADIYAVGRITKNLFNDSKEWSEAVYMQVGANPWIAYFLIDTDWANAYTDKKKVENDSLQSFFQDQKIEWKKVGLQPKSLIMLSARPERFSRDSLSLIEALFGTKQIANLPVSDQYHAVTLIDYFGKTVKMIPEQIITRGKLYKIVGISPAPIVTADMKKNITTTLVDLGYDINTEQFANYMVVLPALGNEFIKNLVDNKENQSRLSEALDLYIEMEQSRNVTPELKEFVISLPPRWLKYVSRYYSQKVDLNRLTAIHNVWSRRSQNQTIPTLEGKVGNYQYELIDKTANREGLFVGYATDCCQVHDGAGATCMNSGHNNPNETFFIVKKKGKIYAQSWVWESTDKNGKKYIAFDSIEVLGKDLNEMSDIMKAYLNTAKELIEKHGYEYAICGADGSTIPDGLEDYAIKSYGPDSMYAHEMQYKGGATYTDTAAAGVFKIAEKKG